jgi:thiamine biosynthesis protein ThiS
MEKKNMKTVTVNGKEYPLDGSSTLADQFARMNIRPEKMAVELNGEIIPAAAIASTQINANDKIEIIQFVGGG